MKRALIALLFSVAVASAQNEAVTIKAKDKTIVNPLVIFPSGKTLECDGCTLIGFSGGGNVSNSGTPLLDQVAVWTDEAHIKGVTTIKGGTTGQVLTKSSNTDYAYVWADPSGGGAVDSVFGRTGVVVATTGDYTAAQVTGAVPDTRTVNGHALSSDVTVTPSDLSLVIGTNVQAWDADLDAVAALSGTGLAVHTGAGTWTERSIVQGAKILVTNGNGVSGNPTIALDQSVDLALSAAQIVSLDNGLTASVSPLLTLTHTTTGTAATNFGASLLFKLESAGGSTKNGGSIEAFWTNASAPHAAMAFRPATSGSLATKMTLFNTGGLDVGNTSPSDPGAGIVNANTGFMFAGSEFPISSNGIPARTAANTWSAITDNSSNWNTAFSDRLKWDGGATDLVAATGRTSLGLDIGTNVEAWDTQLDSLAALSYAGNALKTIRVNAGETGFELATASASVAWGAITGTLSDQTDLQTALDGKIDENGAIVGATKTKITYDTKGLVTAGADATTADIAASTDKNYVTDAQLVVIGNTSGTNTGDQTLVGLGGVPTTRSLTIGPTTADLSADRSFITNVTNDAQTKAAVVPNTAPSSGQILAGNAGGTAYAPKTLSGSGATMSLSDAGVLTISSIATASLSDADLATWAGITPGTGVGTALAVNVGSAGAFVVNGGALGTPSSGTLTSCTFPTLNQNTTGSAASLSISGQTGLLTVTGLTSTNRIKTVRDAADTILELGGSYTPTGTWTSLTMVTPVLGTPTSGTLTNCTALPVSGITSSTSTALGVGSLEVGHATDTTIARVGAGQISVEGVNVVTTSSSDTLTNKWVKPRSGTASAPGATPTLATDSYDVYTYTSLGTAITSMTTNLSGTPVTGQKILLGFKDDGTARGITWGSSFQNGPATLLATTVISKQHWVGLIYDGSKWTCFASDATGY